MVKRGLVARLSTKVYLRALPLWDQYRMESEGPQVRHCKKSFPSCIFEGEPCRPLGIFVQKREHSRRFNTFTVTIYRPHRRRCRAALLHSLKRARFGLRGKCSGGEVQDRGPDLDRAGNADRTLGLTRSLASGDSA